MLQNNMNCKPLEKTILEYITVYTNNKGNSYL